MKYCLYRMKFKTAVHIGDDSGMSSLEGAEESIHADTIFSALCHEAFQCAGEGLLKTFHDLAKAGRIAISDAFPYSGEEYYLPKPVMSAGSNVERGDSKDKKAFKKLKYIPATGFSSFISYIGGKGEFDPREMNKKFSVDDVVTRVGVTGNEEPLPYHVGARYFMEGCGLYFIAGYVDERDLDVVTRLLENLSYSGIGGKRTSGFGRFELDDPIFLDDPFTKSLEELSKMLNVRNSKYSMSMSVCLPKGDEMDEALSGAFYVVVRRGGFVQSCKYANNPLKKKTIHMLCAGSCFEKRFEGDIYDVSSHGNHPVYRYGRGMFVGVDL